jgi:hypothetical protein
MLNGRGFFCAMPMLGLEVWSLRRLGNIKLKLKTVNLSIFEPFSVSKDCGSPQPSNVTSKALAEHGSIPMGVG